MFSEEPTANRDKGLDYREEKKQQIFDQVPASLEYSSSSEKNIEEVTTRAINEEQPLIAQISLNSRFQDQKMSNRQISAPQENKRPEKVSGSLLQFEIAGSKIERYRQLLKAIQKTSRVSIDENNLNLSVDQQVTSITKTHFLTALQVDTEQLPKQFHNLVETFASPQFLLANTYARPRS